MIVAEHDQIFFTVALDKYFVLRDDEEGNKNISQTWDTTTMCWANIQNWLAKFSMPETLMI